LVGGLAAAGNPTISKRSSMMTTTPMDEADDDDDDATYMKRLALKVVDGTIAPDEAAALMYELQDIAQCYIIATFNSEFVMEILENEHLDEETADRVAENAAGDWEDYSGVYEIFMREALDRIRNPE
jgi:hypothetical protein